MLEFFKSLCFLAEEDAEEVMRVIGGILPPVLAVVCIFFYARGTKRKRLIEDTPTSKVKGIFIGLNELKGTVDLVAVMAAYLSEKLCCYYSYSIEEHYTRTRTVRDKDGNTRTETYSGWESVASGSNRIEFDLVDETGAVRVIPQDAEMEGNVVFEATCGPGNSIYYGKGPAYSVSGSNHRRRFKETAIVQGDALYVLGSARLADETARVEIAKEDEIYLISVKSEEQLVRRYGWMVLGGWFGVVAGFAVSPASIGCLLMERYYDDLWIWMIPSGLFGVLITFLVYFVYVFNGLVSTKVRLARAWSLIDIQLKRRYDLIGNLVAICKSFLKHERETQELVANARSGKVKQGEAPSDQQVTSTGNVTAAQNQVINQLFALREAYPELKADGQMLQLHGHLVECEERLAIARTFYNEGAGNYNERIRRVPEVLFARMMGYEIASYYEVAAEHTKLPDVDALLTGGARSHEIKPPSLMGEDEEVVILALVCMMSVDGSIDASEFAAFER
ncbi:MAG: LemA family protein, partial [Planctomycetota bacterium]|nr:LemA family protein [Planctomycetota bacterium]